MPNSINTNISAYFAQANISTASSAASASVSRLSSGNRIVKASDDVAALSTGTSLRTQVTALKTALTNASQGTSLLQVADGALGQVTEILQRQKAIALQAGSGSLTDTDRGYLDQEFQALTSEIDRLTGATNFNGVKLLNGALSTAATVKATATAATAGTLSTTFADNIAVGESVLINGSAFYAVAQSAVATGNQFNVGSSTANTVSNLAARLNTLADNTSYNNTIGSAIYSASNQTLTATARSGGTLSNAFTFNSAAPAQTVSGSTVTTTNASTSVAVTGVTNHGYSVGQDVVLNVAASSYGGIAARDLHGIITAANSAAGTFTFTAQAAATAGVANNSAGTVTLNTASGVGESNTNGGGVVSSFNLFATTTGFTSTTTAISNATTAIATPFKDGDTLTATVNGVASNLYTFGTNATLNDLVNGINASSGNTGFSAALVRDNSNLYNVRVSYSGTSGNISINGGTNYHSAAAATNVLTGVNLSATANNTGASTFSGKSVISSGYIDLFGAAGSTPITAASTANATASTIALATATLPFVLGTVISANVNGESIALTGPIAASTTVDGVVTDINSRTATTGVYALALTNAGNTASNIRLFFTAQTPASDNITVSVPNAGTAASTLSNLTTTLGGLTQVNTATLAGGADDGVGQGNTSITGTVGDSVLQTLGQTKANASVLLTANATANDYITVGTQRFIFTANTTNKAANEILIGANTQETVNNAISAIKSYASTTAIGESAYQLNQLDISGTTNSLVFTAKGLGNVKALDGTAATVSQNLTSGALVGGTLNNGSASGTNLYGVDVTGVSNSAFTGTIGGFTATYKGTASTVDLSVKVGDHTYTALSANVNVTSDTRIRLYSDTVGGVNGGYFDLQLKANQVSAFSDQSGATTVANRLSSAFSSLSFAQSRNLTSYTGTQSITSNSTVIGSLVGTKVSAQLAKFDGAKLTDVQVTAPSGSNSDAKINLVIDGVNYSTASGIGSKLGANQTYKLVNATDANQFVSFTTGSSTIDITSAANASAVQSALKSAFGATAGSAALSFQIGASSTDTLAVSIGSATSSSLFAGKSLNVLTQESSVIASDALDAALETVTTLRASVGALQSRFNFAAANIQISVQNQDAARSALLDTDVASESTAYATSQVKIQAGISVLAQANQQLQNLLKLIQ